MTLPPGLREFAEDPDVHTPLSPGMERVVDERYVLMIGLTWAAASSVRTDDVDATLRDVRAAVAERRRSHTVWWIGPSSRPADLEAQLVGLGLEVPEVSELVALALAAPPPPGPDGVEVRVVETLADFRIASELRWHAFAVDGERRAEEEAALEETFRSNREGGVAVTFLASIDGRPVGTALGVFASRGCLLVGGATAPWARGRGVYRALVRARWDETARRGAPGLVVAANPATSEPILRRLGFEEVCRLRRLEDRGA